MGVRAELRLLVVRKFSSDNAGETDGLLDPRHPDHARKLKSWHIWASRQWS
jgi:hypothetical protein